MRTLIGIVALGLAASSGATAQSVRFVDSRAPAGGDGRSWSTAYRHLQDALTAARRSGGAIREIRVAQGRYTPDLGAGRTPGSRTASFRLVGGVVVRGGYSGLGTPSPGARNPGAWPTVLSGDLAGNDVPGYAGSGENSYHVVTAANVGSTTVLDGCVVRGGYAFAVAGDGGAGIRIVGGAPRFIDCVIDSNAAGLGAGVLNLRGAPTFRRCEFRGNLAWQFRGGAYFGAGGDTPKVARFIDCLFVENRAFSYSTGSDGGAIFCEPNAPVLLSRCEFTGNSAQAGHFSWGMGGALCSLADGVVLHGCRFFGNSGNGGGAVWTGRRTQMADCIFSGNQARWAGAVAVFVGSAALVNCTLAGNRAEDGGGVGCEYGSVAVSNCVLWGNTAVNADSAYKAQVHTSAGGTASLRHSCVQGVLTGAPGEDPPNPADFPGCTEADPLFVDPDGPDGIRGTSDDDLRVQAGSPCLDAGDNAAVPADVLDLDGDGNRAERLPVDVLGQPRRVDDPAAPDVGAGTAPLVDMGAHERQ